MKFVKIFLLGLLLCGPAVAQSPEIESIFKDYAHMRGHLDKLMKERRIVDVMRAFGASDEMTKEELSSLEARVRRIYPNDFENVDVLKSDDMGNGWKRELYAYWADLGYIYAMVLFHERNGALVAINFRFNTSFYDLAETF